LFWLKITGVVLFSLNNRCNFKKGIKNIIAFLLSFWMLFLSNGVSAVTDPESALKDSSTEDRSSSSSEPGSHSSSVSDDLAGTTSLTDQLVKEVINKIIREEGPIDITTSDIQIGDSGIIAIVNAIKDALHRAGYRVSINASNCRIGPLGARALAELVRDLSGSLSLNVARNHIGDEGAIAIAMAIQGIKRFAPLKIACNGIGHQRAQVVAFIPQVDGKQVAIDLSDNDVGDEGFKAIAGELVFSTYFNSVAFRNYYINQFKAECFAEVIINAKHDFTIDLRGCQFDLPATRILSQALANRYFSQGSVIYDEWSGYEDDIIAEVNEYYRRLIMEDAGWASTEKKRKELYVSLLEEHFPRENSDEEKNSLYKKFTIHSFDKAIGSARTNVYRGLILAIKDYVARHKIPIKDLLSNYELMIRIMRHIITFNATPAECEEFIKFVSKMNAHMVDDEKKAKSAKQVTFSPIRVSYKPHHGLIFSEERGLPDYFLLEDGLERIKAESRDFAEKSGAVGPREIPGWVLHDVPGDGNCLFYAVADQLRRMHHDIIAEVPAGTELHDVLRLLAQGNHFRDGEEADVDDIFALARALNVIFAIVDTRHPEHGFDYYYIDEHGGVAAIHNLADIDNRVIRNRPVVRLAYTGNHYLAVLYAAIDLIHRAFDGYYLLTSPIRRTIEAKKEAKRREERRAAAALVEGLWGGGSLLNLLKLTN
jgi:hypothetical protein